MGLAGGAAAALLMTRPGMAGHFGRGQLRALEWMMLGGAAFAGGCVGNQLGIRAFGNAS